MKYRKNKCKGKSKIILTVKKPHRSQKTMAHRVNSVHSLFLYGSLDKSCFYIFKRFRGRGGEDGKKKNM